LAPSTIPNGSGSSWRDDEEEISSWPQGWTGASSPVAAERTERRHVQVRPGEDQIGIAARSGTAGPVDLPPAAVQFAGDRSVGARWAAVMSQRVSPGSTV
jgi:hypothetical protein